MGPDPWHFFKRAGMPFIMKFIFTRYFTVLRHDDEAKGSTKPIGSKIAGL